MLIQQRAHSKKTWPGIWSNACCGHPAPGESHHAAARRRVRQELGIDNIKLEIALPDFRYLAEFRGIVANEICPVFFGLCLQLRVHNPNEEASIEWVDWNDFSEVCNGKTNTRFDSFSPWSLLEGKELQQHADIESYAPRFKSYVLSASR
jgi:isopentenyl-diphosphate delta-isomerase